jgi:hypothetical protein
MGMTYKFPYKESLYCSSRHEYNHAAYLKNVTHIIFYGRAMTSEVEEARHKQTMLNKERAEPIDWVFAGTSAISIAALSFSCVDPLGFPSHLKLSSAFVFHLLLYLCLLWFLFLVHLLNLFHYLYLGNSCLTFGSISLANSNSYYSPVFLPGCLPVSKQACQLQQLLLPF